MTDWTTITDSQVDPKAPVTSELMTALRDNPSALAEGATGAPRIVGLAAATIDEMPVLTVSAADTYDLGLATDFTSGTTTTTSTSYVTAATIDITGATGSARFTAGHYISGSDPSTSTLRLMRNGTQVASWSTSLTSPQLRSVDSSIAVGDEFIWEHRNSSGITDRVSIAVAYAPTATDGYADAPLLIKASDL